MMSSSRSRTQQIIFSLIVVLFAVSIQATLATANSGRSGQSGTAVPTTTPNPSPAVVSEYETLLQNGLQDIRQVQLVEVTDNRDARGKRVITITFETSANRAQDRVNEWIGMLSQIFQTILVHKLDVDEVHLSGVTSDGDPVGTFTTTFSDLVEYGEKRITRAEFLNRAKYFPSAPASTVSIPTPMPTSSGTGTRGTRGNPVPQGTPYEFPGLGSFTVKSEWSQGQTGLAIVFIEFTCERPSSQKCNILEFMLAAVGSSGTVYEQSFDLSIPQPLFWDFMSSDVYGGGTLSGYAGFKLTRPETSLQMRVGIFLEFEEVFFDIS